jgi:phospholipase/carboxylesterase
LQAGRDGVIYVPPGLPEGPAPLILLLHGAGGSARNLEENVQALADEAGVILVVPDSRGPTWDIVSGVYGADVTFINDALALVFDRFSVDADRIAVAGFSDGASYALGLGFINGDLFKRVLAFSPGFLPPGQPTGTPAFYITHGTDDPILPLEATSRRIVEDLTAAGYEVDFHEFAGGHWINESLARTAFALVSGTAGDATLVRPDPGGRGSFRT